MELHKHYKAALLNADVLTSFQVRGSVCTRSVFNTKVRLYPHVQRQQPCVMRSRYVC